MPASEPEEDEVNGEGEVDGAKDEDSGDDSGSEGEDDGQVQPLTHSFRLLVQKNIDWLKGKLMTTQR